MIDILRRLLTEDLTLATQVALLASLPAIEKIRPEELALCAREVLSHAIRIPIDASGLVDIVGTGGDGKHTFNISTTASFVVAASGVPVAKHGNRAVTSRSGGFDLLQALGIAIPETPEAAMAQLSEHGITFLFAPYFHPVFKRLRDARAVLAAQGQRTLFNVLGPLVNPAPIKRLAVGVFDAALIPLFTQTLLLLGYDKACVFHGHGMDELSLMGSDRMVMLDHGRIVNVIIDPESLGFAVASDADVAGGDAIANAAITRSILCGEERSAKRDIVLINAAVAISAATDTSLTDAIAIATASLDSGRAFALLQALRR